MLYVLCLFHSIIHQQSMRHPIAETNLEVAYTQSQLCCIGGKGKQQGILATQAWHHAMLQ